MTDSLLALLTEPSIWTAILAFGIVIVVSMVPVLPLPLLYGTIGFTFPVGLGLPINLIGSLLGTLLIFNAIRYLFHEKASLYVVRHDRARRLFTQMEKNGFQVILIARLIPVVPSLLVNVVSALSTMKVTPFLLATAVGKLPLITLYTVAGNQVDIYTWQSILALVIYTTVLLILANFVQRKWRLTSTPIR
ncbi:TVP38/TMEM64 family protein [Chryseomicrobium aureum]|uniref:TVP38/TMEM64 family protein n=1 Tax=Chryseomicrobium aureum TaxID=1441723 RepID=UPI00370DB51F